MKAVTRSSVCQASPQAGTKGPEKSCWVYFSLHVMWKPLKWWGKRALDWKYSKLLDCSQWWTSEGAGVMNQSPSSHRYSCTKQNKLQILNLCSSGGKRPSRLAVGCSRIRRYPPQNKGRVMKRSDVSQQSRQLQTCFTHSNIKGRDHTSISSFWKLWLMEKRQRKGSTGPLPADCWICSMVLAAGGNYHAVSELPPHQCATRLGMQAKLRH